MSKQQRALREAIKIAGDKETLAKQLGIKTTSVYAWIAGTPVPHKHRIRIELITNFRIRAVDFED